MVPATTRFLWAAVWCVIAAAGPVIHAQESAVHAPFVHDKADQLFVQDALAYGLAHEERLRIIARQTGDAGLVAFATRALPLQVGFNTELKTFIARKDIPPPAEVEADLALARQELSIPPGTAFDRVAWQSLGRGHSILAGLLAHEARSGLDPDIRGWAGTALTWFREQQARINAPR